MFYGGNANFAKLVESLIAQGFDVRVNGIGLHLLKSVHRGMDESVGAFHIAIAPRAVTITAQTALPPLKGQVKEHDFTFHCHYAVPFGNQSSTEEEGIKRISNVRASFNSPFWPFMLNSTSIGQEGLDFHWYCRRVVHWSLPANPIDLEQREGRINRYKSLVVRQRVAQAYGEALNFPAPSQSRDMWTRLFDLAGKDERRTDLVGRTSAELQVFGEDVRGVHEQVRPHVVGRFL